MFFGLISDKKFIPSEYASSIFDINYSKLYASGYRFILTDLDNTLISYKEHEPNAALYEWIRLRKQEGFEIIIVSNNSHRQRVKSFSEKLGIKYVNLAMKPLKRGFKKALRMATKKYNKHEVVAIGDQLLTDLFAANRMHFYSILVKAIDRKSEIFTTRFNRHLEKGILRRLKKNNYDLYQKRLQQYEEENDGRN